MLSVEGRGGQPSYAALFAAALLDPDRATPAAVAFRVTRQIWHVGPS
jgi:hypothetical protein